MHNIIYKNIFIITNVTQVGRTIIEMLPMKFFIKLIITFALVFLVN